MNFHKIRSSEHNMKRLAALLCVIACVIGITGCAWGSVSLSAFPDPVLRNNLKIYDQCMIRTVFYTE